MHHVNLVRLLVVVGLVDADGIDPDRGKLALESGNGVEMDEGIV